MYFLYFVACVSLTFGVPLILYNVRLPRDSATYTAVSFSGVIYAASNFVRLLAMTMLVPEFLVGGLMQGAMDAVAVLASSAALAYLLQRPALRSYALDVRVLIVLCGWSLAAGFFEHAHLYLTRCFAVEFSWEPAVHAVYSQLELLVLYAQLWVVHAWRSQHTRKGLSLEYLASGPTLPTAALGLRAVAALVLPPYSLYSAAADAVFVIATLLLIKPKTQ